MKLEETVAFGVGVAKDVSDAFADGDEDADGAADLDVLRLDVEEADTAEDVETVAAGDRVVRLNDAETVVVGVEGDEPETDTDDDTVVDGEPDTVAEWHAVPERDAAPDALYEFDGDVVTETVADELTDDDC